MIVVNECDSGSTFAARRRRMLGRIHGQTILGRDMTVLDAMAVTGEFPRHWPKGTLMARLPVTTGLELLELARPRMHRAGEILMSQGAPGDQVCLLRAP